MRWWRRMRSTAASTRCCHTEALFSHLRQRWQDLFGARFEVLLYDLTSSYFECPPPEDDNDKRRHGYSRDKRSDCVGACLEALRDDPGLLIPRPPSPPALPGDHLDPTIRIAFLPGIKHGICHRSPPTISSCQAVLQANLTMARWGPHAGYDPTTARDQLTLALGEAVRAMRDFG
jgi:hypothetical protein